MLAKKALSFFLLLFRDFNILDIFYKIQNLNEWKIFSVITHWTYTFLNPWALVFLIKTQLGLIRRAEGVGPVLR